MPDDSLETRVLARLRTIRGRPARAHASSALRCRSLVERLPRAVDASAPDTGDGGRRSARTASAAPARVCCAVDRTAFDDVERQFAAFKGAERALYFSSGYLANLAVLTTFAETGDVIYSDERNHASLIDGMPAVASRARDLSAQRRGGARREPRLRRRAIASWSSNRSSAWTATSRRCSDYADALPQNGRHAGRRRSARGRRLRRARQRVDRAPRARSQRLHLDQHRGQSARRRRRVCRGPGVGHRVSDSACTAVHLLDRAAAVRSPPRSRPASTLWPRSPSAVRGSPAA